MRYEVIVVGSVNADYVLALDRRPVGGETLMATADMVVSQGGKGANQAAAASRAGARSALIGAIGDDLAGTEQLKALRQAGVETRMVKVVQGCSTGTAVVMVTPDGENSIVVAPGANGHLDPQWVQDALERLAVGALVVLQTESPAALIDAAAATCRAIGARVLINNGPWMSLRRSTLKLADPLVVNEHEAHDACEEQAGGTATPQLAQAVRLRTGAASVLVTLGAAGVLVSDSMNELSIPASKPTAVVDTTGAGDAFIGSLAALLAQGRPLVEAAKGATIAAAKAVEWSGARPPQEGTGQASKSDITGS
ncbi:MAG: PfkB family carbohydrate kinase [Dermatophilaceae bacterium]